MVLDYKSIKVVGATLIGFIAAFTTAICCSVKSDYVEVKVKTEPAPIYCGATVKEVQHFDKIASEYSDKMSLLFERQEPTLEWYEEYLTLLDEYSGLSDAPDKIYDVFSGDELKWLFKTVETEVYGGDFASKVNVANVIFNRLENPNFPNTLEKVVTQPNQFVCCQKNLSPETIKACEYAFEFEDTTNGALFFKASYSDTWNGRPFILKDDVGHCFY